MSKELWIQQYESALESISEDEDISFEEAEVILEKRLEEGTICINDYGYGAWSDYE